MSIFRDPEDSAPRNRARDLGCPTSPSNGVKYKNTGTIYYESRLGHRGLFDGWRPVQMGVNNQATPAVGLSPWPVYGHDDKFALKLSTAERTYNVANTDNECATWRGIQLSAIKERFIKISCFTSLHDGGFSLAWDAFSLGLDMQSRDNTQRSLTRFGVRQTYIGDNSHPYTVISITGDGPTHGWVDVASTDLIPGANEGKQTGFYWSYVWDTQATPTTGGLGRPHSGQVGSFQIDLTGSTIQSAAGSSTEPPQLPDPSAHTTIEDFRDTVNYGVILDRSSSSTQHDIYPATAKCSGFVLSGHALA